MSVWVCSICGKKFPPTAGQKISVGMHMSYKHDPVMNAKIRRRNIRVKGKMGDDKK